MTMVAKSRKLVIIGESAFAEIAYEYFSHDSSYDVVAFSVEQAFLKRESMFGIPILPFESLEAVCSPASHSVFVAIAYTQFNRLRTRLYEQAKAKGYSAASYVSTRAFVWNNCKVGEHCFIFEHNVIQPFVCIDNNVILWSGNHIGHHSVIRNNTFVSSHVVVSGFVEVGENSFLGVNATISNNVKVAQDSWIGPGVVITRDTKPGSFYKPSPPILAGLSTYQCFKIDPLAPEAAEMSDTTCVNKESRT